MNNPANIRQRELQQLIVDVQQQQLDLMMVPKRKLSSKPASTLYTMSNTGAAGQHWRREGGLDPHKQVTHYPDRPLTQQLQKLSSSKSSLQFHAPALRLPEQLVSEHTGYYIRKCDQSHPDNFFLTTSMTTTANSLSSQKPNVLLKYQSPSDQMTQYQPYLRDKVQSEKFYFKGNRAKNAALEASGTVSSLRQSATLESEGASRGGQKQCVGVGGSGVSRGEKGASRPSTQIGTSWHQQKILEPCSTYNPGFHEQLQIQQQAMEEQNQRMQQFLNHKQEQKLKQIQQTQMNIKNNFSWNFHINKKKKSRFWTNEQRICTASNLTSSELAQNDRPVRAIGKNSKRLAAIGTVRKNHKILLIVWHELFEVATSKNSLKYCYHQISLKKQIIREEQIAKQFESFREKVMNKLKLQSTKFYFYLKDGTCINSLFDIPLGEITLVCTSFPCFKGIAALETNRDQVTRVIAELEDEVMLIQQQCAAVTGGKANNKGSLINIYDQHSKQSLVPNNAGRGSDARINKHTSINLDFESMTSPHFASSKANLNQIPHIVLEKQINKRFRPVIDSIISTVTNKRGAENADKGANLDNVQLVGSSKYTSQLSISSEGGRGSPQHPPTSEKNLEQGDADLNAEQLEEYYRAVAAGSRCDGQSGTRKLQPLCPPNKAGSLNRYSSQ